MKKLIILLGFISLPYILHSQVITGTVIDNSTKKPVYSASVYFNGTSSGVLTDEKGNFKIDITRYKSMPLTISAIGYYSLIMNQISLDKPNQIFLEPKLVELAEVVIKDNSKKWKRNENLTIFRNEFLGTTSNSLNCSIQNEDDIRFRYSEDKDTIKVFAVKPLLIENKALGYIITYFLDKFEYSTQSKTFLFKGNAIFREDSTLVENNRKYYDTKRRKAYIGSRMHFIRSLWINDLNSEKFTVRNSANEIVTYSKIVYEQNDHIKYLHYPTTLGIAMNSKQPLSFMTLTRQFVYFDGNGYFDADGITWDGNIAMPRLADQLPYDYIDKE